MSDPVTPLPGTNGDRIEAVRFQPTATTDGRRSPLISVRRVVVVTGCALAVSILWFIFTAKSVRLDIEPVDASIAIDGGFAFRLGEIHLLREGSYGLVADAAGYETLQRAIEVGAKRNQTISLKLRPLPGWVTFDIDPEGAEITVVGSDGLQGTSPVELRVPAGSQTATVTHPRYQDATLAFEVQGQERLQTVTAALTPNWADVTIPTTPTGAEVRIDGELSSVATPGPVPVPAGERRVSVSLPGYSVWTDLLYVEPQQVVALNPITLRKADGQIRVESKPPGASVTVDGEYRGVTPVLVGVTSDRGHEIRAFKVGYAPKSVSVTVPTGKQKNLSFTLTALEGDMAIKTNPPDAELWIDGERRRPEGDTLTLSAVPHELEVKKAGYASYRATIVPQPGFPQELKVRLLTLEEARLEALKQVRTTGQNQELVLLSPGFIRMGASRREPGRRANEVLRDVELTRLFYLSRHEVTNAQFRAFASGHDSDSFEGLDLNQADQPVVRVSWQDAARYCNWLSAQDGLEPFYREDLSKIVGFNRNALGYRLPTEAEWAWTARHVDGGDLLRYPWGDRVPPPERQGNYADASAAHTVARIIFGYNDNYIVSSPVGMYEPNSKGIYDIGGNVSEWTHDYYEIPSNAAVVDPLGPTQGEYHVIRGASWMRGSVSDLRLSYRDYGSGGRPDVGFRIARFAE